MRAIRMALAGLCVVTVAAGCSSVAIGVGGSNMGVGAGVTLPVSSRAEVQALADRINRHRVAVGCRPLTMDARLSAIARRHSEDMARRRFFSHTNPDGRDPFDRLQAAGIHYRAAAENIAQGRSRGGDTYADWIESAGHRKNIEDCEYTHFGIGEYQRYWTLELVRYRE